jgi:hypothetical protein
MTTEELRTKYADFFTSGSPANDKLREYGEFTELERALLLRGLILSLFERGFSAFTPWRGGRISRIYFADDSWLGYGPKGNALVGPRIKKTIAGKLFKELGLKKAVAKRETEEVAK